MSEWNEGNGSSRGGGKIWAFFMGLTLLVIGSMAGFYFFIAKPAVSPMNRFAEALGQVTQEKVKVSGNSVVLSTEEKRELVVVERQMQSFVKYETKWLHSDKMIIVKGDFRVKAGFDLADFEGFELNGDQVVGSWPEAKVISVDLLDYEVLHSKSGLVNKLQGNDYEQVVDVLVKKARTDAEEKSDLLSEAERILQQRLSDLSGRTYEWREETRP